MGVEYRGGIYSLGDRTCLLLANTNEFGLWYDSHASKWKPVESRSRPLATDIGTIISHLESDHSALFELQSERDPRIYVGDSSAAVLRIRAGKIPEVQACLARFYSPLFP